MELLIVEIVDFLNNVNTKNFVEAEKQFSELLNDRLAARLETEKVDIAARVFNGAVEAEDNVEDTEVETEVELSSEDDTSTEDEDEKL